MKDLVDISFLVEKKYQNIGIIDVRSEKEYEEDHIPFAYNIPLLNNEERAVVGTIYKQIGPKEARLKGVSIVSPKLEYFINAIKNVADMHEDTIIYCWRGGLRSEASVTFARLAGLTVSRLLGGYKSYRSEVTGFLEGKLPCYKFITVYGPTGSAKTKVLREIDSLEYPFLDLEKYACHKGSSFGHIEEPGFSSITQKGFESAIYFKLLNSSKKLLLTEGESKKIGKVVIPSLLYKQMTEGFGVLFKPSLEFRIKFTVENYKPYQNIDEIKNALQKIKRYVNSNIFKDLEDYLEKGEFDKFAEIILDKYYDPLYKHSYCGKIDTVVEFDSIEEAKKKITEIYNEIFDNCMSDTMLQ